MSASTGFQQCPYCDGNAAEPDHFTKQHPSAPKPPTLAEIQARTPEPERGYQGVRGKQPEK